MRCSVCGQTYGLTHNCAGVAAATTPEEVGASPPLRFAPVHYFREATRIVRWDDAAIRRASRDNNAFLYGLVFWCAGFALMVVGAALRRGGAGLPVNWSAVALGTFLLLPLTAGLTVAQYGVCHLAARWVFHGTGTFLAVLRPLLLGTIVQWFIVIPSIGPIVGGLWFVAVLMFVFEEIEGIERMQAFGISAIVGLAFFVLSRLIFLGRIL